MRELYTIASDVLVSGLRVAGFRGTEGVSQLYRFDIGLLATSGQEIDLAKARGYKVTLGLHPSDGAPLVIHGMIASIRLLHCWHGQSLYQLTLVPMVWAMTLTEMSRVFVDRSIPEIAEQLLADSGIPADRYELRLQGSYPKRLHVCQYKESRWSFLSRLLEREGIYYYFEQTDDHERLVFADHHASHPSMPEAPVRYVPLSGTGDAVSVEALTSLTVEQACLPQSIRVRDYDELKPALQIIGDADIWPSSAAERKSHGEGPVTEEQAKRLAQIRAEQWLAEERTYRGAGRAFSLRSGYRFRVEEHPLDSMNREFLATEVRHHGNQAAAEPLVRELLGLGHADDYRVEVAAIEADTQYRPPLRTPTPCISGLERAFIDGPANSDYAQLDEQGRYKVKLHFDVDDSAEWDGKASTWIRMLQPHAGNPEGFHFPLRKNTEVLVAFLAGDPDRPVIVGAVPNAVQPSPVTRENSTRNVIQTGGRNRIEMEDEEGKQYIRISTPSANTYLYMGVRNPPYEVRFFTDGWTQFDFETGWDVVVGAKGLTEEVRGPVKETYHSTLTQKVTDHVKWEHGSGREDSVRGTLEELYIPLQKTKVMGTRTDTVTGSVTEEYGSQATTIKGAQTIKVAGALTEMAGSVEQTYGPITTTTGPWKGTFASWDMNIPGGATISTPSWKVTQVASSWNCGDIQFMVSKRTEVVGVATSFAGLKIETRGAAVAISATGLVKAAVKIKATGTDVEATGQKTKQSGIETIVTGLLSVS